MSSKKKILYITRYSIDEPFNLQKKFDGQLAAFKNLGLDVYYIGYDRTNLYLINGENKTVYGKTHFALPRYIHTQFYNDLHKASVKAIKEIGLDYIYWRLSPLFGSSVKVAEAAKRYNTTFILEIPTFPPDQETHLSGIRKAFSAYTKRFSDRYDELVDYYAVIGDDAGGSYKGKPAVNIENGIDVNSVHVRTPVNESDTINILALASMCYWHGYDRIIKSLAAYKGSQKVVIHMVGGNGGGCLEEWKALSESLGLGEKVIFHGQMSGDALEEMFNLCDVGVNSLAMYKKNFEASTELKAREYIARGLPFICAVDDPVLEFAKERLWFRIPNDDSVPDMGEIVEFVLKMKNTPSHVQSLRELAENYLTWERQYKKLFEIAGGIN